MALGDLIRKVRQGRGLSQTELGKLTGLAYGHIARLERGDYRNPSAHTLLRLAKALKIRPEELYKAAGYIKETKIAFNSQPKTIQEALAELEVMAPVAIPIVGDIHAGDGDAVEYAYWGKPKAAKRNIRGLIVRGYCLEPIIAEGDVIFIDTEASANTGDIILASNEDEVKLIKFDKENLKGWTIHGVVIEINKRLR